MCPSPSGASASRRRPAGWQRNGHDVPFWYTGRLEHIHTLPAPWVFHDDDFERVLAWKKLGVDDVIEVSVPWSIDPSVTIRDGRDAPAGDETYSILWREYDTPAGTLRHAVRDTAEEIEPGWVIQPRHVPLIETSTSARRRARRRRTR